jgi:hypothetical protein
MTNDFIAIAEQINAESHSPITQIVSVSHPTYSIATTAPITPHSRLN